MNRIPEVLKLVGLEVGEEFRLEGTCWIHKFDVDGNSKSKLLENDDTSYQDSNYFLKEILNGTYEIEKLPFKPKLNEKYWSYSYDSGEVAWFIWLDRFCDNLRMKNGIVFKLQEEAKANANRIYKTIMRGTRE